MSKLPKSNGESMGDGGPAFPCLPIDYEKDGVKHHCGGGMSLLDYFAAKALQGFVANPKNYINFNPKDDAEYCYRLADAMLAERAKHV